MSKIQISEPIIVAQSTTEPILFGGYQDPFIRCNDKGELFVKFNSRRDCHATQGMDDAQPVYKSVDGGKSWEYLENSLYSWLTAMSQLPNGDWLQIREYSIVKDLPELPVLPENRKNCSSIANTRDVYLVDELLPILGDRIAKEFKAYRIKAGTNEITEEICKVNWKNMPISLYGDFLERVWPGRYRVDKNGVLWASVMAPYVDKDGRLGSRRSCSHILRSDDMGHTWDYVSTIVYKEEYNNPNCIDIEGFNETALEFLDDGSVIAIMRSGSLHPFNIGDDEHPAPKLYFTKSYDECKTWEEPKPLYDYGILPVTVKLNCGAILLSSGRPGVYIRACFDQKGEDWEDIIPIVSVPDEDKYKAYFEYSCSNTGICAYNDNTAFMAYSDFTLNAPNGERAKSIIVRKITVTD